MSDQCGEQEWIEAPDGWGSNEEHEDDEHDGGGLAAIFGNEDPRESFRFDVKINDAETKSINLRGYKVDSEETDRSTGVTLWQAAPRLSSYLQENPNVCKGKSVLEVGAGLGLCGITAHYLGAASVIMTDGDTQTLKQLRQNVSLNCGDSDGAAPEHTIDCRQLLWGSPHMEKFSDEHGQYDIILGADVIYTEESREPLFDTVACLLKKPEGRFVLSRYNLWSNVKDDVVIEAARKSGLGCTRPSEGIFLFRWKEA